MKMKLIFALLLLAGCSEQSPSTLGRESVKVNTDGYSATVRMVTTTDGTRCAILVGLDRGGITCDWSHKVTP